MGQVIVITSGKGGTGKTTTVAAVAACLSALGHRVLCVDCDAGLRNLDISLGMSDFVVTDFSDVTEKGITLADAAHEHPGLPGLFFLSAPGFRSPEDIDADAMETLLTQARESFDFCFLDSPAGLSAGFNLATKGADMAIVVATGDMSSIRDAQRTTQRLFDFGIPDVRLLVNRMSKRNQKYLRGTIDDIIDDVGARLVGIVREDNDVFLASNTLTPLVLFSGAGAARDFLDVARRIRGENIPIR